MGVLPALIGVLIIILGAAFLAWLARRQLPHAK